jgi:lysophospholipase L1-like esterase
MKIELDQVILFQGDSITDCGRIREVENEANDNHALGAGYVGRLAGALLSDYPAENLRIFNRGISGNRVVDLYARWKADCVNLRPDWISILIGVNDTWHEFMSRNGVELDRYEMVYRMLLEYTRTRLPATRLVLCEPFVLPCGVVTPEWEDDIRARQEVVRRLAGEFDAVLVPFQQMFDDALKEAPAGFWAGDGVHPTPAGHTRMALFWRSKVGV